VSIGAPQDGQTFDVGAPIILRGLATDVQDGPLSGATLQWTSDQGASLGSGLQQIATTLPVGDHVITLTATDREGLTASASVHITVGAGERASGSSASPSASTPLGVWPWLVVGLVGLALVLGIVIGARGRRRSS
jgi:hypothetical protein